MAWEDRTCKYCGASPINLGKSYNTTLFINGSVGVLEVWEDWDYVNDEPGDFVDEIDINYCPKCGRKF